uniref:Actin-like protein arp6 n=1 Tax=Arundo donax TaxID=35708 RepID=A0A0A9DVQ6_ARUDO
MAGLYRANYTFSKPSLIYTKINRMKKHLWDEESLVGQDKFILTQFWLLPVLKLICIHATVFCIRFSVHRQRTVSKCFIHVLDKSLLVCYAIRKSVRTSKRVLLK